MAGSRIESACGSSGNCARRAAGLLRPDPSYRREHVVVQELARDRARCSATGSVPVCGCWTRGCGPGGHLRWAADSGFFKTIAGVDLGRQAIEIARTRVPDAVLEVAPLHELPFTSHSFDLVVTHDVLQHIPEEDLRAAWRSSVASSILRERSSFGRTEPGDSGVSDATGASTTARRFEPRSSRRVSAASGSHTPTCCRRSPRQCAAGRHKRRRKAAPACRRATPAASGLVRRAGSRVSRPGTSRAPAARFLTATGRRCAARVKTPWAPSRDRINRGSLLHLLGRHR